MTKPSLAITLSGPPGSGKTIVAEIIERALLDAGIAVTPDPMHGERLPRRHCELQLQQLGPLFSVRIFEAGSK